MSDADKMLLDVGYKKRKSLVPDDYELFTNDEDDAVFFWLGDKTISLSEYSKISMKTLDAINKKVEELKWHE